MQNYFCIPSQLQGKKKKDGKVTDNFISHTLYIKRVNKHSVKQPTY